MRIEAYNQVQQLYQTQKVNRTQATSAVVKTDKVQISSIGRDFQVAKAAVAGASDIREDVVASLKEKVQSGTYQVSAESFADKLLAKMSEMR